MSLQSKSFEAMTDEERLEAIQLRRHDVLQMCMTDSNGEAVTSIDYGTQGGLIRGLLKDMDSSIYTKRRLAVDEVRAESDKAIAETAERIMAAIKPIGRDKSGYEQTGNGPGRIDETDLQKLTCTEGELSAMGNEVDLDEITRLGRAHFKGETEEDQDSVG